MNVYIPWTWFATQWPCADWYHVPLKDEWEWVLNIMTWLWFTSLSDYVSKLHLPNAAFRISSSGDVSGLTYWMYWTCNTGTSDGYWYTLQMRESYNTSIAWTTVKTTGESIRPFYNTYVEPDNTWTVIHWTLGSAGIFWNQTEWLISITNWTTWYTISDKNLWATTVFNSWDTKSESNCGKFYQWWNNYWFPFTWSVTTSSTQVDASSYWPWNYYSSSTFILYANSKSDRSSVTNNNLRWWVDWNIQVVNELQNAYIWEYIPPVYLWEYIEYKMNADSSWYLYVPKSWRWHSNQNGDPYSWKVTVDWTLINTYTWTSSNWWSITLSWYTAGSSHIIKIEPVTESYWRALAYWWTGSVAWKTNITEVIYDCSYMWYAVSETNTWDYFRTNRYNGCTWLTSTCEEYLPDTVTTIWNYFRFNEYRGCTSLPYAKEECLPSSVTSIWTYFRNYQYYNKTFTEIKWWKDLSPTIGGSNYRANQFSWNISTIKVLSDLWPSTTTSWINNNVTTVYVPSAYLSNFRDTTVYAPRKDIDDSKFVWY